MLLLLWSCAHRPEPPPPDLVGGCSESWTDAFRARELGGSAPWPADCCSDPERRAWADGFLLHVAEVWAVDLATVERHVRVRHVEPWGVPGRWVSMQAEFRVGWLTVPYTVYADRLDRPPTRGLDAVPAFRSRAVVPPRALLDEPPRAAWRIERDLARCANDLGIPPQRFWCSVTVGPTVDGVGTHPPDVRFGFDVLLPRDENGGSSYATGRAWAWSDEVHCGTTPVIGHPPPSEIIE